MTDARTARLQDEIEDLREEVLQLRAMVFGGEWRAPRELRLTTLEERLLAALFREPVLLTRCRAMMAMYGLSHDDPPGDNIVTIYICKLRAKLKPHGLRIGTEWARGWFLPPETRAWLAEHAPGHASPAVWPVLLLWLASAAGRRA